MKQRPEEFFDAMLAEEQEAPAGAPTFAEKMADMEAKIAERINQVEKNLIDSMQIAKEEPAEAPDQEQNADANEDNNNEENQED